MSLGALFGLVCTYVDTWVYRIVPYQMKVLVPDDPTWFPTPGVRRIPQDEESLLRDRSLHMQRSSADHGRHRDC